MDRVLRGWRPAHPKACLSCLLALAFVPLLLLPTCLGPAMRSGVCGGGGGASAVPHYQEAIKAKGGSDGQLAACRRQQGGEPATLARVCQEEDYVMLRHQLL